MTWLAILLAAAGCYLLKLGGLSVPSAVLEHPVVERVADLLPVALLAALIAVQVFGGRPGAGGRRPRWSAWAWPSWRCSSGRRSSSSCSRPRSRRPWSGRI